MPAHGCNFVVTVVWKSPFSAVKFCGPVTPPWHVLTTALSLGTQSLLWLDRSGPAAGHDLGTLGRRLGCGRPTSAIWRLRAVDVAVRQKSRAPPPLRRGVWAAAVTRLGRRHYSRGSRFLSSSFKQKGGVLWTRTEHPKNPGCSRVKPASRGPRTAARVEGRSAPSPSPDRASRLRRTRSMSPDSSQGGGEVGSVAVPGPDVQALEDTLRVSMAGRGHTRSGRSRDQDPVTGVRGGRRTEPCLPGGGRDSGEGHCGQAGNPGSPHRPELSESLGF